MNERQRGFTLIEVTIVFAIITIIGSITIPNLLSARLTANESAAVATLKSISSAQGQCQASGAIDQDDDGAGEFGYFGELAGVRTIRANGGLAVDERISPPVLSAAFGRVENGVVLRSGYVFQMFLPGPGIGAPFVAEQPHGGAAGGDVDAGQAEILWCCYAWPMTYGTSGRRCFFVNNGGDVLTSRNTQTRYGGLGAAPMPTAAFVRAGGMAVTIAANSVGVDGEHWVVVG
ncbi:MAG: prepilin-type N-terminal cleavage/methylation domain-containing protein [Planctomycetes bacterium]|nr:prepilin-type N-terminal cleavage/methylation domain-containing protein [Planctomycetota bacterium]